MEGMLGYTIKIQEKAGSKLQHILSNTDPWSGSQCGRVDCTTCSQDREKLPDCTKRNLVYESRCAVCNKEEPKGELLDRREEPSIYVGETNRSIYMRGERSNGRTARD